MTSQDISTFRFASLRGSSLFDILVSIANQSLLTEMFVLVKYFNGNCYRTEVLADCSVILEKPRKCFFFFEVKPGKALIGFIFPLTVPLSWRPETLKIPSLGVYGTVFYGKLCYHLQYSNINQFQTVFHCKFYYNSDLTQLRHDPSFYGSSILRFLEN